MSYQFYKVLHLSGIMLLILSLGGALAGGPRKLTSTCHGVAMLAILVGGFGLLARLGLVKGFPGWVWAKLGIWVVLGGMLALARKMPKKMQPLWFATWGLGAIAAFLAVYKPF